MNGGEGFKEKISMSKMNGMVQLGEDKNSEKKRELIS